MNSNDFEDPILKIIFLTALTAALAFAALKIITNQYPFEL